MNEYNKRLDKLDKTQKSQGLQLSRIESMLGNHLAHHEIDINRWMKIYIPALVAFAPIAVAFANSEVLTKLIDLAGKFWLH